MGETMMERQRPPEPGVDAEVERGLTEWGQFVRETAELRSRHVRIDPTGLLQAVLRPYRRWERVFRWTVGLAVLGFSGVGLYLYVLREWGPHEWRAGSRGAEAGSPGTVLSQKAVILGPDGPVDPDLPARVHALLMALRRPGRSACPDRTDGLDFRLEMESVRQLYRAWALTAHRWDDPYGEVLRRLAVTVGPCLSPAEARTLQAWSQDVSTYLYLVRPGRSDAAIK